MLDAALSQISHSTNLECWLYNSHKPGEWTPESRVQEGWSSRSDIRFPTTVV